MEHSMEILKGKMKVESDDMNDAETLMDYAEMSKGAGDADAAVWFHKRAKTRWSQYEEDARSVNGHIDKMKAAGKNAPDSVQAAMLEMLMDESKSRANRLRSRIENFSASLPERDAAI